MFLSGCSSCDVPTKHPVAPPAAGVDHPRRIWCHMISLNSIKQTASTSIPIVRSITQIDRINRFSFLHVLPIMAGTPSPFTFRLLRRLVQRPFSSSVNPSLIRPRALHSQPSPITLRQQQQPTALSQHLRIRQQQQHQIRPFSSTPQPHATYNQVRRGCHKHGKKARKLPSPAVHNRPHMKGVCLKTGTTKPRKPNSGERKVARIRLTNGMIVSAYIPGEGMASFLTRPC